MNYKVLLNSGLVVCCWLAAVFQEPNRTVPVVPPAAPPLMENLVEIRVGHDTFEERTLNALKAFIFKCANKPIDQGARMYVELPPGESTISGKARITYFAKISRTIPDPEGAGSTVKVDEVRVPAGKKSLSELAEACTFKTSFGEAKITAENLSKQLRRLEVVAVPRFERVPCKEGGSSCFLVTNRTIVPRRVFERGEEDASFSPMSLLGEQRKVLEDRKDLWKTSVFPLAAAQLTSVEIALGGDSTEGGEKKTITLQGFPESAILISEEMNQLVTDCITFWTQIDKGI